MKLINITILFVFTSIAVSAFAGDRIIVRSSDEAFDAFKVRDQILKDHEWQESLRLQQQIKILEVLPLGCALFQHPFNYYACGSEFYRPYIQNNAKVFVQIDPVK